MSPRQPAQSRSRATRDAVLAAAMRLAGHDIKELTAQAIAQEAGVAVGTLYQYFEGVDAVLDVVVERHLDRFEDVIHEALATADPKSVTDAALAVNQAFVEYYVREPGFHALWFGPKFSPQHRELDAANNPRLASAMYRELVARKLVPEHPDIEVLVAADWEVADVLMSLAFRLNPMGDPLILEHLQHVLRLLTAPPPDR